MSSVNARGDDSLAVMTPARLGSPRCKQMVSLGIGASESSRLLALKAMRWSSGQVLSVIITWSLASILKSRSHAATSRNIPSLLSTIMLVLSLANKATRFTTFANSRLSTTTL